MLLRINSWRTFTTERNKTNFSYSPPPELGPRVSGDWAWKKKASVTFSRTSGDAIESECASGLGDILRGVLTLLFLFSFFSIPWNSLLLPVAPGVVQSPLPWVEKSPALYTLFSCAHTHQFTKHSLYVTALLYPLGRTWRQPLQFCLLSESPEHWLLACRFKSNKFSFFFLSIFFFVMRA